MALTKKDFQAVASSLKWREPISFPDNAKTYKLLHEQWESDCDAVARGLAFTNPQFEKDKFLAACGIKAAE